MDVRIALFFAIIGLVAGQGGRRVQPGRRTEAPITPITQECMNCICEGSSDCDATAKCHNAGAEAYYCGPYVISWAYWHDGGRPGDKGRSNDFETCLNDKTCAEQAVRGYMKKHGKDCDKDGAVTCYDFARIHKMGPGACSADNIENTDYWEKFLACYDNSRGSVNDYYASDDQGSYATG